MTPTEALRDQAPEALLKTLLRDHHEVRHPSQIWATCQECRDHYEALARHLALGAAVERIFDHAGKGYDYISVTKHADRMDDGWVPDPKDRWCIESGLVTLHGHGPTLTAAITEALGDD